MNRKPTKPRKCSVCKSKPGIYKSGFKIWCGDPECGTTLSLALLAKQREKEAKRYRAETKKIREKYETIKHVMPRLAAACNWWIRERDWDLPCPSCDKPIEKFGTNYHAGHFIPYGSKYRYSPLRIDGRNIHGQCSDCNKFNGGRRLEYEQGLVNRYGQSYVDEIYELKRQADSGELKPVTVEQAKELIPHFRKLARELKKQREI